MELKRKIFRSIQRFFEISPIHGCSYVGFCAATYEAVFWLAMLGICAGFCVSDIVTLSTKYNEQITAVQVVMQRNQTLELDTAAICFDVFRSDLAESISAVFNETTFNETLAIVAAMIKKTPDLSQLKTDEPNVDLILKTTYLLLAAIVDYDIGIPGGGMIPYDASTSRAVNIMNAFYTEYGFNYEQLYQQTARFLCKQTQTGECMIADVGFYVTTCLDICGQANITWLGITVTTPPDDICFALNTNLANVFQSPEDSFHFQSLFISRISRLIGDWDKPIPKLANYGTPKIVFEMRGWEGLMDPRETDSVAFVSEGVSGMMAITIASQFVAYNRTEKGGVGACGSLSAAHCALWTCLPAARAKADGCWPLAGYTLTSAVKPAATPICGRRFTDGQISQINNLGQTNQYTSPWEMCVLHNCSIPPCVSVDYQYFSTLSEMGDGLNATLYQGKPAYPVFNEYVVMDFASYLATFGGIIGLWLGGSLISIVHLPVFVICAIVNNYMEKNTIDDGGARALRQREQLVASVTLPAVSYGNSQSVLYL